MAIHARDIIGTVVGLGRGAVSAGTGLAGRVRREAQSRLSSSRASAGTGDERSPSGAPRTVGAPNAGEPGAPRSSTSSVPTDASGPT